MLGVGVVTVGVLAVGVQLAQKYNFIIGAAGCPNPRINPGDFTTTFTNKYFTLKSGQKIVYEADTEEGVEKVEITISGATKKVKGVTTLVYRDKVFLDKELVEDTRDYLAQNKKTGDVWYFGEDVDNYEGGKLVDHDGSWLAGEDGARPGIWVKANPKVGETYCQEYFEGEAEDKATVKAVNERVKIGIGTYTKCLKTLDWTPLDADSRENKYYCPQVGTTVLVKDLVDGKRTELVSVKSGQGGEEDGGDDDDDEDDGGWGGT